VASALRVRCIRSCRPFCCGDAGAINSGRMPRRIHQTDNVDRRPSAVVAKGTPLSVRMIPGKPYSWKRCKKIGRAVAIAVESKPWQVSKYRLKPSTIVNG
jgi:hypothetical protein